MEVELLFTETDFFLLGLKIVWKENVPKISIHLLYT